MDARIRLSEIVMGHMPARAVQVAAHLGLPELVRDGTNTGEALSQATGIDPWRMGRFLRFLVAMGLFRKKDGLLELTEMGILLCRDSPDSMRDMVVLNSFDFTAWTELEQALLTGRSGYELSEGRSYFEAMDAVPEFAASFDSTMNSLFVPETAALIESYDFGQYGFVMDVGGGNGEVLIQALNANPGLSACLFDLPHVVDRATSRISDAGLKDRCECIGGSFFDSLPRKANAILLRHILHDWHEEDAARILNRCHEALEPGGVVLIGEAIIEDADTITFPIRLDLMMLTFFNGAERTLEEYRQLASKAGLEVTGVVPITPVLSVIEARGR